MKISLKGRAPVSNDSVGFSVIVFCDLYPTFARGFFSLWRVLCKTGLVATTCFHLLRILQPPPGPLTLPPLSAPLLSSFLLHSLCTSGGPASWTAPKKSWSFRWIIFTIFCIKSHVGYILSTRDFIQLCEISDSKTLIGLCETHQDHSGLVMIYGLRTSSL